MCKKSHDFEQARSNLLFEQNIDDVTLAVVLVCAQRTKLKNCVRCGSAKNITG